MNISFIYPPGEIVTEKGNKLNCVINSQVLVKIKLRTSLMQCYSINN